MRCSILTASCLLATASAIPSNHNLHARHHPKNPHSSSLEPTLTDASEPLTTTTSTRYVDVSGAPYGIGNNTAILPTGTASAGLFHPQASSHGTKDGDEKASNNLKPVTPGQKASPESKADNAGSGASGTSPKDANAPVVQGSHPTKPNAACDANTVTVTANKYITVTVPAGGAAAAPSTKDIKPSPVADSPSPAAQSTTSLTAALGAEPSIKSNPKQASAQSSAQKAEASPDSTRKASAPAFSSVAAKPVTSKPAEGDESNDTPTKPADDTPSKGAAAPAKGQPFKTKRGIIASGDVMNQLAKAFGGTKISWLGNWYSEAPKTLADGITFVPQNYGRQSDTSGTWTKNAKKAVAAGEKFMLSFGEPGTENDKLFMTPQQGVDLWRQKMEPYAKQGVTIGAPGTLQNTKDFDWLKEFLSLCNDCTIGFIALHWYDKAGAKQVPGFKETVEKAHVVGQTKNIPVWLDNFQAQGSMAAQKEFLGEVVPWLDAQPYVAAYAYVPTAIQNGGDPGMTSGDSLNELGQYYANL